MIGLVCKICGYVEKYNLKKHLEDTHNTTTKQYKTQYPNSRTMTGHSRRTVEYWYYKGFTLEQSVEKVKEEQQKAKKQFIQKKTDFGLTQQQAQQEWNDKQAMNSKRSKQYYISRGLTEQQAEEAVSKIQAEYSKYSSKFQGKVHTEESKQRISKTMQQKVYEVGADTYLARFKQGKEGYRSRQEVDCFLQLQQQFPEIIANVKIGSYIVDMQLGNIVVEFYGDFWHRNPMIYKNTYTAYHRTSEQVWQRDQQRQTSIQQAGLKYHIIWESTWKSDKNKIIESIKKLYEDQNRKEA